MHILLTNDDGIQAPGLWALYNSLVKNHSISVIAPDREQSAIGHAITLNQPLRATRVSMNGNPPGYAVSGTPADCVKLGILELLESKPDMLISGINPGANVGVNVNYSGTVAAAKEAALYGITALAVSSMGPETDHYDDAAAFVAKLADKVADNGLPFGTFLNVNIPNLPISDVRGIRISKLSVQFFPETIEKRIDPRNRTYYWQGSDTLPVSDNPEIDGTALSDNCISITPITCDVTDYNVFEAMKGWGLGGLK
jgi:5'-nucleotidase